MTTNTIYAPSSAARWLLLNVPASARPQLTLDLMIAREHQAEIRRLTIKNLGVSLAGPAAI